MKPNCNLNDTYFMVTNCEEMYRGHKFTEGKNYSNQFPILKPTIYIEPRLGFPFTTINFVHLILRKGCYIREITLPEDEPLFQITEANCTEYSANCIILGKRYNISDLWEIYQEYDYYNYIEFNHIVIQTMINNVLGNCNNQKLINLTIEKGIFKTKNLEPTIEEFVLFFYMKKYHIGDDKLDCLIKIKKLT